LITMQQVKDFFAKKEWFFVACLVLVFILIRLSGVHLPLHQDEYKWPIVVNPANTSGISIPHPPLSEFIYRMAGEIVGFNVNFRFVPLFFGSINLILLFYLVKSLFGKKEAVVASLIWIFSYFSVLASLMVDTDGEILPFFFLLSLIAYYKTRISTGRKLYIWMALLVIFCILGFMVKVSFIIAIGAIVADFLWDRRKNITKKEALKYIGFGVLAIIALAILLAAAHFAFSFFDLSKALVYWEHFIISKRDWFQIFIQCVKALLYSSPFLVLLPFFGEKEDFSKVRVFVFFLILAFIFYIVLFDFSIGALDRYFQLLILPLSVFSSIIIVKSFEPKPARAKEFLLLGSAVALIFILLQSLPHFVPALHPKSEWISRVISLRWNFVYPFSGGSGPLGFYVSFLFMALSWIVTFCSLVLAKIKPNYKTLSIMFLIPIGVAYNGIFIEEYLVGLWNGHAPTLVTHAVEFIKNDSDIKFVTVYNDNGGNEIMDIGKYRKRLYFDPKLNQQKKVRSFNEFKEYYFVLDVPRLDPTSFYQKYFDSCQIVYSEVDKKMTSIIYDCRSAPDISL